VAEPPTHLDSVFAALGDPTRRAVLRRLAEGGAATATELAGELPVTRQAVAKHLGLLGDAGLVAPEKRGREVRYRCTPEPLLEAMGWMAAVGARWDQRLAALRSTVERRAAHGGSRGSA
jgi:DNA-binding transcriptional ArsR family regulator